MALGAEAEMIAIVGGGIVGLAVAHALRDLRPVVFEKEARVGAHQTGHNSGVIHSGVYYRPGSQKARMCVEGGRMLVEFCKANGIVHRLCGKVIVAADEGEIPRLEELERRAIANGVSVERIGPDRLREIEPNAQGAAALWLPGAGIVDFGEVARKLAESIEVRTGARVASCRELGARLVVNCAGLQSDRLARSRLRIVPFRGEFYQVQRPDLVRGLIYPVPDLDFPFLGVHFTRTVHGTLKAGPNAVLAFAREGYRRRDFNLGDTLGTLAYPGFWRMARRHWRSALGEMRRSLDKGAFVRAAQRLVPCVKEEDLVPYPAGVRAQLLGEDGRLVDDFHVETRPGEIHVLNAPSPAATACLAIGRHVAEIARRAL